MVQNSLSKQTLGEIVTENFRTAEVFKDEGLDFCCGGKKSLEEACMEKNLNMHDIIMKLNNLAETGIDTDQNYKDWSLDRLIDHIINKHHKYIQKNLPELIFYTKKLVTVHSARHPELLEIADLFDKLTSELLLHMHNEEEFLFPAIIEAVKSNSTESKAIILMEVSRMMSDHEFTGTSMERINKLTSNYRPPFDACNTYHLTYKLLRQFEDDLHVHIHLENNILFPKSIRL